MVISQLQAQSAAQMVAAALRPAGLIPDDIYAPVEPTPNTRTVLERRYLKQDDQGQAMETASDMYRRVAVNLAQADRQYGADDPQVEKTAERFYQLMASNRFLPNSPTLMNAGRELQQLSACFVLPVPDDMHGIFQAVHDTAMIHKTGGGTGFDFSELRPAGDRVGSTTGVASGPVSFIDAFDVATEVVKQGGTRRGANMGILRVDHPDILEFIARKADGAHLQNFNISVAATDEFMTAALADAPGIDPTYQLFHPRTGDGAGRLNAREVLDQIVANAWQNGDPGIIFIDVINRSNPNAHVNRIAALNPCGEQILAPNEACNLGSVNLARLVRYDTESATCRLDHDALAETINCAVHLLDNVIDMNQWPLPAIEAASCASRRIGLGVMGFADLLVMLGIPYNSPAALETAREIMAAVRNYAWEASQALARHRGAYPLFQGSSYDLAGVPPMRNTAPVTIAPTGTISIIASSSSGIEPLFALAYQRHVMENSVLTEFNPLFQAVAQQHAFDTPALMDHVAVTGQLDHPDAPQWARELFAVSHQIPPRHHVDIQAAFQAHTDNAVSKTINLPHDATEQDVREAYCHAWRQGCKGITVYRDGSKINQVLTAGNAGSGTAETSGETRAMRPRPRVMDSSTIRINTGHGTCYVTISSHPEAPEDPFEVFASMGKAGSCDSAHIEAICRLASTCLRSGVSSREVLEQLEGITCHPHWDEGRLVKSTPDAIAAALDMFIHGTTARASRPVQLPLTIFPNGTARPACPDCGESTRLAEGCETCLNPRCGWSRCE